jgi:hypothetical protein
MVWSVNLRRIVAEKLATSCKNGGEEGVKVREQRRYKKRRFRPSHTHAKGKPPERDQKVRSENAIRKRDWQPICLTSERPVWILGATS